MERILIALAFAAALRPLQGSLIEAQSTSQQVLYLWDATPYVAQLVKEKRTDAAGLRDVEATAVRALAGKAASLKTRSGVLRVLYERTGAVSPIYGSPIFAGTERLMTVSASGPTLRRYAGAWPAQVLRGKTPIGLKITVTGKLPPS